MFFSIVGLLQLVKEDASQDIDGEVGNAIIVDDQIGIIAVVLQNN